MKLIHSIFITLLVMFLTFIFSCNVAAMTTGFKVETAGGRNDNNINIKSKNEEYYFHSIECFDVSDKGLIAVGISEDIKKYINVYDNDGIFKYGYSFEIYGTFGIEFDNDNIIIYTVRGDKAYLIDKKGNCLEICDILNNSENNSYWNNVVFARLKESDGNKYYLSKNKSLLGIFSSSYSQLIKRDSNGDKTVLLDASNENNTYIIVISIMVIIVMCVLIMVVKYFWSQRTKSLF